MRIAAGLKSAEQGLRHLRDTRLMVEEAVSDERVDFRGRIQESSEQRFQFFRLRLRSRDGCRTRLVFIFGTAQEGPPIDTLDLMHERLDGRRRAGLLEELRSQTFAEQCA